MSTETIEQLLNVVWLEERAGVLANLEHVETVALALLEGPVSPADRLRARRAAHQLVVVGTFGFDAASLAMREAEQLLDAPRELTPTDGLVLARLLLPVRPALESGPPGAPVAGAPTVVLPDVRPASAGAREVDVLLVEDDPLLVPLLRHALEAQGRRVEVAGDGPAALTLLTGDPLSGAPAQVTARLVLLDVDLPGASGMQVLRRLRAAGVLATTRVVVLTARSTEGEVLEALELGATDHVAKPFSLPVLLHRVRLALPD